MTHPSIPRPGNTSRVLPPSSIAPVAAGIAMVGALVASAGAEDGVVLCPFRRCTGGYCPGCGSTRAAHRLLRGDLGASWTHHPWVVLATAQLCVIAAIGAFIAPRERLVRLRRVAVPLLVANTAILIAIWIARLSADSIPTGWF